VDGIKKMSALIAIVDDEPDILELVSFHLKKNGFDVRGFADANGLYTFIKSYRPDLVILDLMLPDADGIDICKYMKKKEHLASIPIIILSAKGEEADKILGLELGADDYVTKPFSPRELVARVKAVLRRQESRPDEDKIEIESILTIDPHKFEARVKGKKVALTSTEFRILKMLCERKGWVFTRDQILYNLWGHEKAVVDRTVDVHIKHLREKLGAAGKLIQNVRGVGYKLDV